MMDKVRKICKLFLPPIITNLAKKPYKEPVTYEGTFESFSEVGNVYKDTVDYDNSDTLIEIKNRALEEVRNYKNGEPPTLSYELIRVNLLSIISSVISKKELNFLDVGGGLGTSYLNLLYSSPDKINNFTILELPETVEIGRDVFKDYANLKFIDSISPNENDSFDIIHIGSSLQYFEGYKKLIGDCCELKPEFIAIVDTAMGPAPTFVAAQVNMVNRTIPRWVFNIDEIADFMDDHLYDLIHKSVNYYSFHNFSNYSGAEGATQKYNLIFQRRY